jgi:hypothetical protein
MPGSEDEVLKIAQFVPPDQPTGVAAAIDWFLSQRSSSGI